MVENTGNAARAEGTATLGAVHAVPDGAGTLVKSAVEKVAQDARVAAVSTALEAAAGAVGMAAEHIRSYTERVSVFVRRLHVGGAVGGVMFAAALALPGVGLVGNIYAFVVLLLPALVFHLLVKRWRDELTELEQSLAQLTSRAVSRIGALGDFDRIADELETRIRSFGKGGLSGVLASGRFAHALTGLRKTEPLIEFVSAVCLPFRQPLLSIRVFATMAGAAMAVLGPLVLVLVLLFR